MLKNIALAAALCALPFQAGACSVNYNSSTEVVLKVVRQNGWGFDNYDQICQKLAAANAALVIDGQATVLGNKSIAWATVSLKDKTLMVFTNDFGGSSTKTNDYASQDKAEELLMQAINSAVDSMGVDKALRSLAESRRQAKAAYSR